MNNFISFFNSFLSYLILFGVFVILACAAVFIGITLRKKKNAGTPAALAGDEAGKADGGEAL